MPLSKAQRSKVAGLFSATSSEEEFQSKLKKLGLDSPVYEDEIADLIFAIATNKPVPKSNG